MDSLRQQRTYSYWPEVWLLEAALSRKVSRSRGTESELQKTCERFLELRGYRRMTADSAVAEHGRSSSRLRGWFGHVARAKGNPFMPDLFVIRRNARPLMVELKVRDKYQPGQLEMVEMGWWILVKSFDEFISALFAWEHGHIAGGREE